MKSDVNDYLEMMEHIYRDATIKCVADVSDLRDLKTIKSRVEYEGISFLTITLPKFSRDFEKALALGRIDSTLFRNFAKRGPIPAFLQGMVSQLFNRETGEIHDYEHNHQNGEFASDTSTIVESVRQICCTFKKIELECSPKRLHSALVSFVSIEQDLAEFSAPSEGILAFSRISSMVWGNMFSDFSVDKLIPRHGPGATAEHISGNRKYSWKYWYDRIEPYFPLVDSAYPIGTPIDSQELKEVTIVPETEELPVRVVFVPKTLQGPRVIAIEPCCMQYAQQGVRDFLYKKIESNSLVGGHINFSDQTVNQELAIISSKTGQFATIDLSDASDRVPLSLVEVMLETAPDLLDVVLACRSTKAQLPDGTSVGPLRKFASMGSALCFPIEAMYFYTICVMALLEGRNLSITLRNIKIVTKELYIYGDDIIVPSVNATIVLDYLRKYNCKVNTNKTFVSGSFRESCGIDAYDGYQVTPVYLRQPRPENKQQARNIISWIASSNQFYRKGYWATTQFIRKKVERIVGNLPYVSEESEGLGYSSFLGYRSIERWNSNLQRFEIKTLVARPVLITERLEGYGALMKCFLGMSTNPPKGLMPDPGECSQLEQSALRGAVTLKRRWVRA